MLAKNYQVGKAGFSVFKTLLKAGAEGAEDVMGRLICLGYQEDGVHRRSIRRDGGQVALPAAQLIPVVIIGVAVAARFYHSFPPYLIWVNRIIYNYELGITRGPNS